MSQSPQTPLKDIFTDCLLGLRLAVEGAPNVTKALQLSVLGLRLSRWGEAVDIYKTPGLGLSGSSLEDVEEDLYEATQALNAILTLLNAKAPVAPTPQTPETTPADNDDKRLLETLDRLVEQRLEVLGREASLSRPPRALVGEWSDEKSIEAADQISALESLFGARQLRRLSSWEQAQIRSETTIARLRAISSSLYNLDPWSASSCEDIVTAQGSYNFVHIGAGYQNMNTGSGYQFDGTL
jgi:hypothetical protein